MKALVIAHGHPDFSVGGAEIAAYNLFIALGKRPDVSSATFLARTDLPSFSHGSISIRRSNEYLWRQDIGDWFRLRSASARAIRESFHQFLRSIRPDVVFVHHFAHLGVEILLEIRKTLPDSKVILTLHEYMSICHNKGQMIKFGSKRLCYRESADDCSACFPGISMEDFWLRRHYILHHFGSVDYFVSPSEFLRRRYIDWGIEEEFIDVIENGQPDFADGDPLPPLGSERRVRIGYFGQVTEFKGVDLLLRSMHQLIATARDLITIEVHAANLDTHAGEIRDVILKLRDPLIADGSVRWIGAYERSELRRRMAKVDWVIIPSIWWENSPMVIQEAFAVGRPVIAANIGGMAEKVRDGVDGLHFEARNPVDLGETLLRVATDRGLRDRLASNIRRPLTYDDCAAAYLGIVSRLG